VIFKGSGFYVTDHRKGTPSDDGGSGNGNGSAPKTEEKKVEKAKAVKSEK
jgi:predicted nucleic acid-binding Zn ribbon protein